MLSLRDEQPPAGYEPLLEPLMVDGHRLVAREPLPDATARLRADLDRLTEEGLDLRDPRPARVARSPRLAALIEQTAAKIKASDSR